VKTIQRSTLGGILLLTTLVGACAPKPQTADTTAAKARIPITTASDAARDHYLAGREMADKFHFAEARSHFAQAIEADPDFALAYFDMANSATTNQQFFDNLREAKARVDSVSEGERLMILATAAGVDSDPAAQQEHLEALVAAYPADPRAHTALATFEFGRQEYQQAIGHFRQAVTLDPAYSQPHNMLGYAYRSIGDTESAESEFQAYIAALPDEANPYDSYAELLMKLGRYEESIDNYRKALAADPAFASAFIGIANNQIFMGTPDDARATLDEAMAAATDDGQRSNALLWKAWSYVHDKDYDSALAALAQRAELSRARDDLSQLSGDLNLMGNVLDYAGRFDEAAARYAESLEAIDAADVDESVKVAMHRNTLADEARAALMAGDTERAAAKVAEFGEQAAAHGVPFELRLNHELQGLLALAQGDAAAAAEHLQQAGSQDPRVLYELAQAQQAAGDTEAAVANCELSANWRALSGTYAYVRADAQEMLGTL
jgi:tetratricopeptide (TPR) repeat protein